MPYFDGDYVAYEPALERAVAPTLRADKITECLVSPKRPATSVRSASKNRARHSRPHQGLGVGEARTAVANPSPGCPSKG